MDFEFARAIVRAERLEGHDAWQMWSQTTRKDHYANIPSNPQRQWPGGYGGKGWKGWNDWLKEPIEGGAEGTGEVRGRRAAGRHVGGMWPRRSHWKRHAT